MYIYLFIYIQREIYRYIDTDLDIYTVIAQKYFYPLKHIFLWTTNMSGFYDEQIFFF